MWKWSIKMRLNTVKAGSIWGYKGLQGNAFKWVVVGGVAVKEKYFCREIQDSFSSIALYRIDQIRHTKTPR